jgi:aliphatic sulfonates family ABC transporter substrate-binding protein
VWPIQVTLQSSRTTQEELHMKRRQFASAITSLISAAAVAALGVATPLFAQTNAAPIPIRIGIQAQTSWLLYTAKELKLFEKEGLAPTYVKLTTGAQAIPAMQSRSIDIGSPGITPFTAGAAQGVNWKLIGIDTELPAAEGFLARKDSSIKTLEDFKGKTIGVARGSTSYYGLLAALKKKGIGKDQVNLLQMGPPEQLAAMLNNNVEAVAVWEPWIQKLKTEAGARLIGMEADYGVHTAVAVYAVHGDFAKENPEAVRRFLRALLAAYDHIQKDGPDVALDAVASAMGVTKDLAAIMYKEGPAPSIRRWNDPKYQYSVVRTGPFAKEAQEMADFLAEEKIIAKKVDLAPLFDDSFINAVLTKSAR